MSFVYKKPQPSKPGKYNWCAKVQIGDDWQVFGLGLKADARSGMNKTLAEARLKTLELVVKQGITDELKESLTNDWMNQGQLARLRKLLGETQPPVTALTWGSLAAEFCEFKRRKKVEVDLKINPKDYTAPRRQEYVEKFHNFLSTKGITPNPKLDLTQGLNDYLAYRAELGNAYDTLRGIKSYIVPFADFVSKKVGCPKPDRDELTDPETEPNERILHSPAEEISFLQTVYDHRHDSPTIFSAWSLLVVVRGLGARPSEAVHLHRKTVTLSDTLLQVEFKFPKENRRKKGVDRGEPRKVPILWQWVVDGLKEILDSHENDAVCVGRRKNSFKNHYNATEVFRLAMRKLGIPDSFTLKKAQKYAIHQLIDSNVPTARLAQYTGHDITTLQKNYLLTEDHEFDSETATETFSYGRYGVLSASGRHKFKQWGLAVE